MVAAIRAHRGLSILVGFAVIVRVLVWIAFYPAVIFSDSLAYMDLAWAHGYVGIKFDRPSGYPWFMWAVGRVFGHHAAPVSALQLLLSLLAGVLLYALLIRFGVRRWLALVATGLVLFDAYVLTLSDEILADVPTMILLVVAVWLLARPPSPRGRAVTLALAAAAGLLIGYAITVRTAAAFVVPVVLMYALWGRRDWLVLIAVGLGLAVPVLGYLQWHKDRTGSFSFIQADGWFLYARIGWIGACGTAKIPAAARPICPYEHNLPRGEATYIWGGLRSPAREAFGVGPETSSQPGRGAQVDHILWQYALAIIRDRPLVYARMVARDLVRYFQPGEHSVDGDDVTLDMAQQPRPGVTGFPGAKAWLHGYREQPRLPRSLVDAYGRWIHTPRWLLGAGVLFSVLLLLAATIRPRALPLPRRREAFLMLGSGLFLVVGATATAGFALRYLVPALPLLWGGITLVTEDVLALVEERSSARTQGTVAAPAAGP